MPCTLSADFFYVGNHLNPSSGRFPHVPWFCWVETTFNSDWLYVSHWYPCEKGYTSGVWSVEGFSPCSVHICFAMFCVPPAVSGTMKWLRDPRLLLRERSACTSHQVIPLDRSPIPTNKGGRCKKWRGVTCFCTSCMPLHSCTLGS